jgi:hypothetical protein
MDAEAIKTLRSLFANRAYVQPEGAYLRINFAELVAGVPLYHTALTVPNEIALQVGHLIMQMATAAIDREKAVKAFGDGPTGG